MCVTFRMISFAVSNTKNTLECNSESIKWIVSLFANDLNCTNRNKWISVVTTFPFVSIQFLNGINFAKINKVCTDLSLWNCAPFRNMVIIFRIDLMTLTVSLVQIESIAKIARIIYVYACVYSDATSHIQSIDFETFPCCDFKSQLAKENRHKMIRKER